MCKNINKQISENVFRISKNITKNINKVFSYGLELLRVQESINLTRLKRSINILSCRCVRGAEREPIRKCFLNTEQSWGTVGASAADKLP